MRQSVVLFIAVVLVATVTGIVAAQPSVSITLTSEDTEHTVADGERVVVPSATTIHLEASAEDPIESLVVRLDGTTVERFAPNASTVSESVTLNLDDEFATGEHDVTVIANAASTTTVSFTLVKDDERPFVSYRSPVETNEEPLPDRISVSESRVTIAGDLTDITRVTRVDLEATYQYRYAGQTHTYSDTEQITDPGGSFSTDIYLGNGENDLTVTVVDAMDNRRVHESVLAVSDTASPTVDLDVPAQTDQSTLTLTGEVRDGVQLESVVLENPRGGRTSLLSGVPPRPDPERRAIEVEYDLALREGDNTFTVEATDLNGNVERETFTVTYERDIVPAIDLDRTATTVADGSVSVRGVVDDGEITSVVVETVGENGDILDIAQVYTADTVTNEVVIQETLSVDSETPTVRVRAVDSEGTEHVESFTIGGMPTATATPTAAEVTDTPEADQSDPTATITHTQEPTEAAQTEAATQTTGGTGAFGLGEVLAGLVTVTTAGLLVWRRLVT